MTMKKTTPKKELTEAELIIAVRGELSFRAFEAYLNEKIPMGAPGKTTFASAWNWVNEVHPVNSACLWAWATYYPKDDPRHQLSIDILALRLNGEPEYSDEDKKKVAGAVFPKIQKEKVTV